MKDDMKSAPENVDAQESVNPKPAEDPIGDETDGEARAAADSHLDAGLDAETEARIDTYESEGGPEARPDEDADAEEDTEADKAEARPAAKLERLQKILSQAGIASRRKAEEMIEQGRVQVNGQVVSTLGAKADPTRDHIRVDGKLLHGAERHRYFILNKPKGFVTTVSDPEGRPTVMEFFSKMPERLYPVGRLDYLSEGLLLVTNDGDLANLLTRASTGVEKTYLVKIAGQPTPEELDHLRQGVAIDRGQPGQGRVHTAPAVIRQVRHGDNPWFEVVLIEGRNRELRKMFEEIGHFVEKIRRVGYGPLVLDLEPGKLRELDPDELAALHQAAEGKKRTPKAVDLRRRIAAEDASLPPAKAPRGKSRRDAEARPARTFGDKPGKAGGRAKPFREGASQERSRSGEYQPRESRGGEFRPKKPFGRPPSAGESRGGDFRPKKSFGRPPSADRPFRPRADEGAQERPARRAFPRNEGPRNEGQRNEGQGGFAPRQARGDWQNRERPGRFESREGGRPAYRTRPGAPSAGRGGDRRSSANGGDFNEKPSQGRAGGERRNDFRPAGRSRTTGARFDRESRGEPRGESGYRPKPVQRFGKPPASPDRPQKPFARRTEEQGGAKPRGANFARPGRGSEPRGPERRGTGEGAGAKPKSRFGTARPASGQRGGGRPNSRPNSRPGARPGSRPSGRSTRSSGPRRPGSGGKPRG